MKYLLWGGAILGAYFLFFKKKATAEEIVAQAVGPKPPTTIPSLSQSNLEAIDNWKMAFRTAFPQRQITKAYIDGELVCVSTPQGGACATLMDALTLSQNELMVIANFQGQKR